MPTLVTYGPGGYDPAKPNGNVIDVQHFDDAPQPTEATLEEKIAAVIEAINALVNDRPADAADAIATVTNEGAAP